MSGPAGQGRGGSGSARRLVVVTVVIALALGAAGAFLAWRGYETAKDDEARRIAAAAAASSGDVGQFVGGRIQVLQALTSADAFVTADRAAITDRLGRLSPDELGLVGGISWFDGEGRVTAARGGGVRPGTPAAGRLDGMLRRVRAEGAPFVGPAVADPPYPAPVVPIVVPTRDAGGEVNGTLVGAMPVAWIDGIARGMREERGGDLLVIDRDGRLIAGPGSEALVDVSADPLLARARQEAGDGDAVTEGAAAGVRNPSGVDGRLIGFDSEPAITGWTVLVDRSAASAYGDARRTLALELVGLGLLVALGVAAVLVAGRRIEAERAAVAEAERRTGRLQRLTASLSAAATPADVADAVLQLGQGATGADAGSIALLSDDGRTLVTLALVGYSDEVNETFPAYPADADLPMPDCLRDGPLWLPDGAEVRRRYPHLAGHHAAMRHEAVASMPLVVEGRAIGGVTLSFAGRRDFGADERSFLLAVAGLCAQALDRARLYEAQRREADRARFLAEASTLLATPLDPRASLAALARLAVPGLADWCSVSIVADGAVETLEVAHADPERVALARDYSARFPAALNDPTGVGAVIRTGRPEFVPELTPELIREAVPAGERRDAVLALGLASVVTVPLQARGRTLGALLLACAESGRRFDGDDLRFATDLGARAGLAIENAMLLDRSRQIAATLQRSLLPARLPEVAGLESAARYIAGGEGVEVGGDFYDLFAVEGGDGAWMAVLGDVCGKGPEAAALTSLARYTIRADAGLGFPGAVLERLNRAVLHQVADSRFLTAACAVLRVDAGGVTGRLARGGHPPPLVMRSDGAVEVEQPDGPLIGVLERTAFEERDVRLAPGDALVLYSDGVSEARAPDGAMFGVDGITAVLSGCRGRDAESIAAAVEEAVTSFRGDRPEDDVAILVLRAAGPEAGQ